MKKISERYQKNFPLILLITYSLGYIYINRYYSIFEINIENYISLSDILFLTINFVVFFALAILIIYLIHKYTSLINLNLYFRFRFRKTYHKIKYNVEEKNEFYENTIKPLGDKQIPIIRMITSFLILFIFWLISGSFLISITLVIPFIILTIIEVDLATHGPLYSKFFNVFICNLIAFIIILGIWGYRDAFLIRSENYKSHYISFNNKTEKISTKNSNLKYIGNTTDYLFLFNIKTKTTLIFSKQDISNLKINRFADTKNIQNEILPYKILELEYRIKRYFENIP